MQVDLSEHWRNRSMDVGHQRQAYAESRSLRQYGNKIDPGDVQLSAHVLGAIGECAVAKILRRPWRPNVGTTHGIDVDNVVEVRARRIPGTGRDLAIRPDDKDAMPYVLVHVYADGRIDLVGWLFAYEAKGHGPWCESRCVWYVPPPYRSIESLIELFGASA